MTKDMWRDIYSGDVTSKSIFMQRWDSLTNGQRIFWLFIFATVVTAFYGFFLTPDTNNGANSYNLHRNLAILFFGIFGGGLAIWARLAQQTQLEHTEKQIENSLAINRNDRYVKSVEMLEKDKSEVSYRGGLHILGELMKEGNKAERTLYGETITEWLKGADVSDGLIAMAMKLLTEN